MSPGSFDPSTLATWNARLSGSAPERILEAAVELFHPRLACACSLGLEDVLLVDLIARLGRPVRIFFLDTGRLHQETYDTLAALRAHTRLPIEVYCPRAEAVEALLAAKGPNSFYESLENRLECCRIRKVEPLGRALAGTDAWITGLRRGQGADRASQPVFEWDAGNGGLVKISPLAAWTLEQVQEQVRLRGIPCNPLHALGYPSIGCAPCTRAVPPGQDPRSGRWWWEADGHRECGLHRKPGPNSDPAPETGP